MSATRTQNDRGARETILDAAISLFALHGYDGVSFRDITERCGAKRPLILYHFGSKDDLWREALLAIKARVDGVLEAMPEPEEQSDPRKAVADGIRAMLEIHLQVPEFGQVLVREGGTPGERLDWIVANFTPSLGKFAALTPGIRRRIRSTMVRDLTIGSILAATALGPFLEASTAVASRVPSAGIYPMNAARRDELVDLLTRVIIELDDESD